MGTNAANATDDGHRQDGHQHHGHRHDHGGNHEHGEVDWAAMGERLEREGDVMMALLEEAMTWLATACADAGVEVRTVLDVGSGPGVGTSALAGTFTDATVVALDRSPELLERAQRRADRLGLGERISTMAAALPGGVADAPEADLIWASMVVHHVTDPAGTLTRLRRRLRPGGLIALAEFADPARFLPADLDVGRPGLAQRVEAAGATWIATMGSNGHEGTPPSALPAAITAAGLEVAAERVARCRLDPPLSGDARHVVASHLARGSGMYADMLDADDRAALDTLADPTTLRGVLARPDVFYETSRRLLVLRPI